MLEDLAAQCRSLEDLVEDRDREMEQLYRDLEQGRTDADGGAVDSEPSGAAHRPDANWDQDSDFLYRYGNNQNTEVLNDSSLIYLPGKKTKWKTHR